MHKKIGRNEPCPCRSGLKFKRCHGLVLSQRPHDTGPMQPSAPHVIVTKLIEGREFQRREQQGLGRPIVSTKFDKHRVVAVGPKVYWSEAWKTFHDFLRDYPRIILGEEWWLAEIRKPRGAQHRIVEWYVRAFEQMKSMRAAGHVEPGLPATGALSAYMRFAYDLYELKHSVNVEPLLISRLKCPEGFPGATYEVRVAASLLRAGFTLELENESDRRTTHVEFVATHIATKAKFSVEAKRREGARLKVNKLLHNALTKHAEYPRIVFVDTNDGRLEMHRFENLPIPLAEARKLLKLYTKDRVGTTLPAAYVLVTHAPEEHHLDVTHLPFNLMLWGFHVADMKPQFKSLLQEVLTRRAHVPIFALLESIENHRSIPVFFDGEADAFALNTISNRLTIGARFVLPGPDGNEVDAVLENGIVMPNQKQAGCIFIDNQGQRFMCNIPLTDDELAAYRQHPSTFFGAVDPNAGRKPLSTPLDYFNFVWEGAKDTPKDLLLDQLKGAGNITDLAKLSQYDLATQFCARMAGAMMRSVAPSESLRPVTNVT